MERAALGFKRPVSAWFPHRGKAEKCQQQSAIARKDSAAEPSAWCLPPPSVLCRTALQPDADEFCAIQKLRLCRNKLQVYISAADLDVLFKQDCKSILMDLL